MNRSMLIGVVAGIGVATAGGVASFTLLGKGSPDEEQVALVEQEAAPEATPQVAVTPAPAAAPAPRQTTQTTAAPRPTAPRQAAAAPPPAPAEECWDEVVEVVEAPKDQHRIAGTAAGAVVGGVIGKEVGDSDLSTAAGAAAGAFIGRRLQRTVQENREEQRTTTTVERRCAPAGTR